MGKRKPTGIEARVCADIAARQAFGIKKYNQSLADNPADLRSRLQHAYEESLDHSNYLKWAMDDAIGRALFFAADEAKNFDPAAVLEAVKKLQSLTGNVSRYVADEVISRRRGVERPA